MTVRFVCILAVPRTGSTHVVRLLSSCRQLNIKRELFDKSGGNGGLGKRDLPALETAAGGGVTDPAALSEWRRQHPTETLETLHANGAYATLVFKLFPNHLTKEQIAEHIFSRDDVAYIILKRRPIDSYISSLKAEIVGTHSDVETTSVKPALETEAFVRWIKKVRKWYTWIGRELEQRNRPRFELSYDDHLNGKSNADALSTVLDAMIAMGVPAVERPVDISSSVRQDREPRYQDRVSNWESFETEMGANERSARLLSRAIRPKRKPIPRQYQDDNGAG